MELAHREAQALTAAARLAGEEVLLAKPQTYMNLSGMAVARLLEKYDSRPAICMVLVDDADFPWACCASGPEAAPAGTTD